MDQRERDVEAAEVKELASHIRTYRNFVFAVRIILSAAAVILLLMAYFLL